MAVGPRLSTNHSSYQIHGVGEVKDGYYGRGGCDQAQTSTEKFHWIPFPSPKKSFRYIEPLLAVRSGLSNIAVCLKECKVPTSAKPNAPPMSAASGEYSVKMAESQSGQYKLWPCQLMAEIYPGRPKGWQVK